jgi:RNA polymerase sigma factor (TIGR02999 family)
MMARTMSELDNTVYQELRAIARARIASQQKGHTLQATALVNEAWMKLRDYFHGEEGSPQFYKTAADAMRQILIDHARSKQRLKRGGKDAKRIDFSDMAEVADLSDDIDAAEILALDEAIAKLERDEPDAAQVVKLRFFAGLSVEETATALGVSDRTVKREWRFARAWLFEQMRDKEPE